MLRYHWLNCLLSIAHPVTPLHPDLYCLITCYLFRRILQIWTFFRHDRTFYRANLQANSTVNAGREVNPIPVSTFGVLAGTLVNTGNRASINAIGNAFTNIRYDRMRHSVLSKLSRNARRDEF